MNFDLSEEQTMIQDSIARFVQDHYSYDQRHEVVALPGGFSAEHWQQFAELGWLSIPFDEQYGGFGGGPVDSGVFSFTGCAELLSDNLPLLEHSSPPSTFSFAMTR